MSESIMLEGREYVSAKRASEISGYARDYIGQLARKGLIGAQRVGGLWYVSMESLQGYQKNAESYQPVAPMRPVISDLDTSVSFDGKDYISASRASKLTGYNQDYIGQLARAGKVLSRQIGNRWYIEREGLLAHKNQKDSMLASVQREAVGLAVTPPQRLSLQESENTAYFKYISEAEKELLPGLQSRPQPEQRYEAPVAEKIPTIIPIRTIQTQHVRPTVLTPLPRRQAKGRKSTVKAAEVAVALTFVIMLSYGLISLKSTSMYTLSPSSIGNSISKAAAAAAASEPLQAAGTFLENILTRELTYKRTD